MMSFNFEVESFVCSEIDSVTESVCWKLYSSNFLFKFYPGTTGESSLLGVKEPSFVGLSSGSEVGSEASGVLEQVDGKSSFV